MPPAVGVRPSALRCAPRATNRAVTQPTFLAVMFVMLSPANRVFGYGSWIAAQRCVGAAEAAGLTTAARAVAAAARRARRERMRAPIPPRVAGDTAVRDSGDVVRSPDRWPASRVPRG